MHNNKRGTGFFKIIVLLLLILLGCSNTNQEVRFKESVVAGSPDQFMEVRHVVIKGTNFEIGKMIGKIAQKNGITIHPSNNLELNRAKRTYIETHYPVFYERMKGVAEAFGLDIEDDRYNFCALRHHTLGTSGCSAVFYPGKYTATGHGLLGRNYDYTTGTLRREPPAENELPVMSRPYIFELYPDEGYASLSILSFDYLGGTLDGINSEGLAVSVLADGESMYLSKLHPTDEPGIHELLCLRYLLDHCKDASEAKKALLSMKHYYRMIPCHYIVADRYGNSFIFEISSDRDSLHITEGKGPQCITNHLVYKHQNLDNVPPWDTFERYRLLHDAIQNKDAFTIQEIEHIQSCVAFPPFGNDKNRTVPHRTLWYAFYDTHDSSLNVKFYLGDILDSNTNGKPIPNYSDFLYFKLSD